MFLSTFGTRRKSESTVGAFYEINGDFHPRVATSMYANHKLTRKHILIHHTCIDDWQEVERRNAFNPWVSVPLNPTATRNIPLRT